MYQPTNQPTIGGELDCGMHNMLWSSEQLIRAHLISCMLLCALCSLRSKHKLNIKLNEVSKTHQKIVFHTEKLKDIPTV